MYRLNIRLPDGSEQALPLRRATVSLGRAVNNDLSYPEDSGLSRQHMAIEWDGDGWLARDLGSKNGTLLNDQPISDAVRLQPGDRITVSRIVLTFEDAVAEDEPDLDGTVIFDPVRMASEKLPTHTVTLGELLPSSRGAAPGNLEVPDQWGNPVTALLRAGRELVANKPVKNLFRDILELSMEAVGAGRGVLLALEGEELRVQACRGGEFHISSAVRDRVLNERSSLLISDAMSDEALRDRQSIVMQRVRSLMAVPLQTDERVLGIIYVDTPHLWREFKAEDLNLLTVMANVAAIRIERERMAAVEQARRLMERDLSQAAEIQQQLLPRRAPDIDGFELAGYNRACRTVGGDYYDYIPRSAGKMLVALGDVAGKGMPAALLMVNLQARVQMLAEQAGGPAAVIGSLNRAMIAACPANRFVTFFLCQINPATGEIAYSNAGHNPPYLVRAEGSVEELTGGGPVLGILPGINYDEQVTRLEPGDTIVLFSDGVSEAVNPAEEEFGEERLVALLRENRGLSASALINEVRTKVEEFTAGAPTTDDITLVVIRCTRP